MIREKAAEFISGRISFKASDGFVDLFLGYCRSEGAELYSVTADDSGVCASVKHKDIEKVCSAALKSGMNIHITGRRGLRNLWLKYKRRYGIPAGLLIASFLTAVLSSVIWSIDISGNEEIPDEVIYEALEEAGVTKGMFRERVNCDDAEFCLANRLPQLSWVSVYVAGSRMFVEIREREKTEEPADTLSYSNIVAAKDGEIVRADIFTGDGKIYPGTAVLKGDLLVNGVVTMRDGGVKFVDSEAVITARTRNSICTSAATSFSAEAVVRCKDRYLLYFFGIRIPLGMRDKENTFTKTSYFFDSGDIVFPVGLIRENYTLTESRDIVLSEAQAAMLAFADFAESSFELCENSEVLESEISLNFSSQAYVSGEYLCIEDIALKKQFTVEDTEKQSSP